MTTRTLVPAAWCVITAVATVALLPGCGADDPEAADSPSAEVAATGTASPTGEDNGSPDPTTTPATEPSVTPEPQPGIPVQTSELAVGDCWVTGDTSDQKLVVPCDQPHEGEVFLVPDQCLPEDLGTPLSDYVGVPADGIDAWAAENGLTVSISFSSMPGQPQACPVSLTPVTDEFSTALLTGSYRSG